jgi:hypothetical protein
MVYCGIINVVCVFTAPGVSSLLVSLTNNFQVICLFVREISCVMVGFKSSFGLPGCVEAIDGSLIP